MKYLHKFDNRASYEYEILKGQSNIKRPSCTLIENTEEVVYDTPTLPFSSEDIKLLKPLTFDISSDGTIVWKNDSYSAKTIKYCKNNQEWVEITSSREGVEIPVQNGDTLQFKGSNTSYGYYSSLNAHFEGTATFDVSGNIMSMLNENENIYYKIKDIYYYQSAFLGLFSKSNVINAKDLLLPATRLSSNCYSYMFSNCSNLISTPKLTATDLASSCYSYMFYYCTSLTTAPELPATTLKNQCYAHMFQYSGLTSMPELLAEELEYSCYENMFTRCNSLTSVNELPAKTIPQRAYYEMFSSCANLVTTPAMNGVTLARDACSGMFNRCNSLTNAGNIIINSITGQYACSTMFEQCYSLTVPPVLSATTLMQSCYAGMFRNCTALTTSPVLPAVTLVNSCYSQMFAGCPSLNNITCLATDISASSCINNWVCKTSYTPGGNGYSTYTGTVGVAATGTFTKADGITWPTGASGIPTNWTVQIYQG